MQLNTWYEKIGVTYRNNGSGGRILTTDYQTKILYIVNSQSEVTNKSNITVKLYCRSVNPSFATYGFHQTSLIPGGYFPPQIFDMRAVNVWQFFAERTFEFQHNENGTLNCNLYGSFTTDVENSPYALLDGIANTDILEFPTIARKSTCSFNDFIIGNSIAINTNRVVSTFTHTLKLYVNNVLIKTITDVGASVTITPSEEEITAMYNATSNVTNADSKIVCTTYSGATNLGNTETIKKAIVDTTISKPIFSNYIFAEANAIVEALTNEETFVKGFSNIMMVIDSTNKAIAKNGATMSKYKFFIGSKSNEQTYATDVTSTLNNIDSNTITVTAVDSRGLETPITKIIPLIDYIPPVIQTASTQRLNGVETETNLSLTAKIFDGDFGNGLNIIKYFGYRVSTDGITWSLWFDKTTIFNSKMTNTSGNILLSFTNEFELHANGSTDGMALGQSYYIQLKLSDGITAQVFNSIVGSTDVNDGKVLDGHYKSEDGNYRSGYGGMPVEEYNHKFYGNVNIDDLYLGDNLVTAGEQITNLNEKTTDSGWINLITGNGWTAYDITGNYAIPQYRKIGKVVYVRGMVAGGINSTLAQLPAGFRPINYTYISHIPAGNIKGGRVDPNGTINLYDFSATWNGLGGIMFFVD